MLVSSSGMKCVWIDALQPRGILQRHHDRFDLQFATEIRCEMKTIAYDLCELSKTILRILASDSTHFVAANRYRVLKAKVAIRPDQTYSTSTSSCHDTIRSPARIERVTLLMMLISLDRIPAANPYVVSLALRMT